MTERPDPTTAAALARLYDLDVDDPGDLDLYAALADRVEGPILELAAGTGRVAVPLAARGYPVTAVDIDPEMLDRARQRAARAGLEDGRLMLVEADLVDYRAADAGRHTLTFIALNSIMLLPTRDAQRAAVATLATHLQAGGIAVVDAWLPDAEDLGRFDGQLILEWVRTDAVTGAVVTKSGSAIHDAASGTVALTAIFDEGLPGDAPRRWIRQDRLRLISADELVAFAEEAGLRVETLAGGYDLAPIGPGSERAVLIAERR